jgi:hypothetical protein
MIGSAYLDANLATQLLCQDSPGVAIVGAEERKLEPFLICGFAADGDPGAVWAAVILLAVISEN